MHSLAGAANSYIKQNAPARGFNLIKRDGNAPDIPLFYRTY